MKNWTRRILALLMAAGLLLTGFAAAEEPAADQPEGGMRFTLRMEEMARSETGMDIRDWEMQTEVRRFEGQAAAVTREDLTQADPAVRIYEDKGQIYMIDGLAESLPPVADALDAYETVYRLCPLLGGGADARFRLWSVMTADDHTVYVFQQVYEGLTVVASTAKLVTDAQGRVRTVFSSLAEVQPVGAAEELDAAQAEEIVRGRLRENGWADTVLPEYTMRAVIPADVDVEDDSDTVPPDRLAWVVFSRNPRFEQEYVVDLPYMAHFVGMDGAYLSASTVAVPGDRAARSGYPASYSFEFMEAAEWTGEVRDVQGGSRMLTVPVMRDTRTGTWYLGDPQRRIAVADFSAFFYGERQVAMVSSPENGGWEDEDLLAYANMVTAWDFYAQMGWIGPDGVGTPLLLLRHLATEDGEPIENACYISLVRGWQCFAYGQGFGLGQGLDVLSHEFTHCVTTATMNANLYQDEKGAINEAMSDILGNLCEGITRGGVEERWLMGEDTGTVFRSMRYPNEYDQPGYVWDLFYVPNTYSPNDANDRGGVHFNSSIPSRVAASLCADAGMPLERARDFWMTVSLGLTPQTDFRRMVPLLGWALELSGNGEYRGVLDALVAETRMDQTDAPLSAPEDRIVVRLEVPDTEAFADENWVLFALQIDVAEIRSRARAILDFIMDQFSDEREASEQLDILLDRLHLRNLRVVAEAGDQDEAGQILRRALGELFSQHFTWRAVEKGDMAMVVDDKPTVYALMNVSGEEMAMNGLAVLISDEWFDLAGLERISEDELDAEVILRCIRKLWRQLKLMIDPQKTEAEDRTVYLPTDGLEHVQLTPQDEAAETDAAEAGSEAPETAPAGADAAQQEP